MDKDRRFKKIPARRMSYLKSYDTYPFFWLDDERWRLSGPRIRGVNLLFWEEKTRRVKQLTSVRVWKKIHSELHTHKGAPTQERYLAVE